MQIINLSEAATLYVSEAASRANAEGKCFRLAFGCDHGTNWVKWKVGEGMWTVPFYDEPDEYRDAPESPR